MKIAIYINNSNISNVDCSDLTKGNPGIGGTEYCILLLAQLYKRYYPDNQITLIAKTGRNGELTKELWIDRRERSKSLTWSSVMLALGNIKGEVVDRPKALGDIRGVTYIFGMFYRFGLIDVPDEVKEKMKHPKQNTGKQ